MRTVMAVFVVTAALSAAGSAAAQPLVTALFDPAVSDISSVGRSTLNGTGATVVRIPVAWREVAPASLSPSFNPRDEADPSYRWDKTDRRLERAVACGLQPMVDLVAAPAWATVKGTGD